MTQTYSDPTAIEVTRSDSGTYEIPGGAEVENWEYLLGDMQTIEDYGELKGWGEWERVYRATDDDGHIHWYFVRGRWI